MSAGAGFAGAGAWTRVPRTRGRHCLSRRVGRRRAPPSARRALRDRDDRDATRSSSQIRATGTDPLLHRADGRQLRRLQGPRRVGRDARKGSSCARRKARPGRTGCAGRTWGRDRRDRHALARPAPARPARCGRRSARARPPEIAGGTEGKALVAAVSTPEPYVYAEHGRIRRRRRLRDEAIDPPAARRRRRGGDRVADTVDADTLAGHDGVVLSNGRGDPDPLAEEAAVVRDLLGHVPVCGILSRPSVARPGNRPRNLQAAVRPPRRESPRPPARHGPSARHLAHGFAVKACSDDSEATAVSLYDGTVDDSPIWTPGPCSSIRRQAPGPARTRGRSSRHGWRKLPRRTDIESICLIRLRPIVIGRPCQFPLRAVQALMLRESGRSSSTRTRRRS